MSCADHEFLFKHIARSKPQKVLEIGIAAGGTTKKLLEYLSVGTTMYSVDLNKYYYKDKNFASGFMADEVYNSEIHPTWVKLLGKDVSFVIDDIGAEIDFVILDTVHSLPGEVLNFLAILPYLKDNSVVFLHDINLHALNKLNRPNIHSAGYRAHACAVLFSAIFSKNKYLSKDSLPNSGVLEVDKEYIISNLYPVMTTLLMDWHYMPNLSLLTQTGKIIKNNYPEHYVKLYEQIVEYNIQEFNARKLQSKKKESFLSKFLGNTNNAQ